MLVSWPPFENVVLESVGLSPHPKHDGRQAKTRTVDQSARMSELSLLPDEYGNPVPGSRADPEPQVSALRSAVERATQIPLMLLS